MASRSESSSGGDVMTEERIRPIVDLPRSGIPTPLIILLLALLAVGLFLFLDGRRRALQNGQDSETQSVFQISAPPPPLVIPPAPQDRARPEPIVAELPEPVLPPAVQIMAPLPVVSPLPAPDVLEEPQPAAPLPVAAVPSGPGLIVDFTRGSGVAVQSEGGAGGEDAATGGSDDAVRATLIRNRHSLIPQGTIISAVLETPLNSDRPGPVRAVVSRDARSFDGSRVLIPRGSRLIGEFRTDTNPNQRRVLVTWTRLIRPDGVAIRIGSPAADGLGGIGVAGRVNTHFFQRFAGAVLQSALTIGVNVASQAVAREGTVYVGLPGQIGEIGKDLIPNVDRQPTVKVNEGAEIAIFVARDLDFGGTPAVR